jgi:predicted DNA-binding protein with PD1-like motif
MKQLMILTTLLHLLLLPGLCQDTPGMRNIETPSSAPNNPAVPDAYVADAVFQRIKVVRLKHNTDMLEGLQTAVREEEIENAVILAGIGSLTSYHVHSVSNTSFPSTNDYVKRTNTPMDLLTVQGYVIDGKVHAHITLSDTQVTTGGHLEPGCSVFTFAIITLGILDRDADLSRFDDKTWR